MFRAQFCHGWTVELQRSDDVIEKITITDATLPDHEVFVPENIREITLKRVRMGGKRAMVLPINIKKITIKEFTGNIRVHGLTLSPLLMCMHCTGSFCCSKTTENEELFEISMSEAHLSHSVSFLPGVSTVNMSRVYIDGDNSLNLTRNVKEVSLHSCVIDRVCFGGMPYFRRILLGPGIRVSFLHVEVICFLLSWKDPFVMPQQNFNFSRLDGKITHRLFIYDFKIRETIHFGPEVEEFEFCDVIVSNSDYVAIDGSFKKLELSGCEGRFKIPGIFSDSESRTIEMAGGVDRLVITKTAEDSYDILLCFCSFKKLTIEMNIATAKFYGATVIESLLITGQRCENLILDQFTGPISIPNVVSFKRIELSCLEQLDMSSNVCTLLDRSEATHFTSCSDTISASSTRRTNPELGESDASTNILTVFGDRCADICVSRCIVPVNIIGVLRNTTTNVSLMCAMPTDEFDLVGSSPKHLTKLKLVGNRIHGMWRVERDVSFLSLSKVSSEEGSALYLNDGLESIRVHCSQLSIDATNAKNLKAITLIDAASFVYNPSIHVSLSYLSVQEMTICCNIDLTPCLYTFMLTRSTLIPGFVIRVNERISHLSISKFMGVIDVSGVVGLGEMRMTDQHELYFDRPAVGKGGSSLHITNYEFEKDVLFSDDLENIRLKCIGTAPGVRITLGQGCECLKLDSSTAIVDFSRALRLKKIILRSMPLHVLRSLLAESTAIEILVLQDMTIGEQIEFPSNLRTILLQDVRVMVCSQLSFNQECIEVCLYRCTGTYDLSKIEKLEILSSTPELMKESEFKIELPSLASLQRLDIAYNLNNERFASDLFKGTNLEGLTVRSLNYSKKHTRYPPLPLVKHDLYDFSGINPWSARNLSRYQLGPGEFQAHDANLLNWKMNITLSEIFTFNFRNKLKYLNLVGCGLDEENVKALKQFVNLQVLVIDCAFFDKELIENMPNQLETLEVVDRKIFDGLCVDRCKELSSENFEALRRYENIRHLVFTGCISKCERIFNCLLLNLESLKIANFCADGIEFPAMNGKKIVIKRLALVLDDPDCYPPVLIDNNPMKRQSCEVFDCLRGVFDFNRLQDLMLEASGRCVSLDNETYRIK